MAVTKGICRENGELYWIQVDKEGRVILAPESIEEVAFRVACKVQERYGFVIKDED